MVVFMFILVAVFLVSRWLITSIIMELFKFKEPKEKESKTEIHYHITNNNLHVNEDKYNRLKK